MTIGGITRIVLLSPGAVAGAATAAPATAAEDGTAPATDEAAPLSQVEVCEISEGQRISLTSIIQNVYQGLIEEMDDSGDAEVLAALGPIADILRPNNEALVGQDGQGGAMATLRTHYPEIYARYQQIEQEIIAETCASTDPGRVSLTAIISEVYNRLIAEMDDSGDATVNAALSPIADILLPANNDLVGQDGQGGAMATLRTNYPEIYARYTSLESESIRTEQCGCREVTVPVITDIALSDSENAEIAADSVEPGQELIMTITGRHFPSDAVIEFLLDSQETDSNISPSDITVSEDGTIITLNLSVAAAATLGQRGLRVFSQEHNQVGVIQPDAFTIVSNAPDMPLTCRDDIDNDHDLDIDTADSDCAEAAIADGGTGEQPLTGTDLASYYLFNVLRLNGRHLQLSAGGHAPLSDDMNRAMQPVMSDMYPNLGLTLHMGNLDQNQPVTIWGRPDLNPITSSHALNWLAIQAALSIDYQSDFQDMDHMFDTELGLQARFYPHGNVYIDAFGKIGFAEHSRQQPIHWLYDGRELSYSGGLALGSDFGQPWLDARAFLGEYRRSIIFYDPETYVLPGLSDFDGGTESYDYGLRLDFNFSRMSDEDSQWVPDAWISWSHSPWGRIAEPQLSPSLGVDTYHLLDLQSLRGDLGLVFRSSPVAPFLTGYYARTWQGDADETNPDNWPVMQNFGGTVGIDWQQGGIITLGLDFTRNATMYMGGDINGGRLDWTLPWLNRSITVRGQMYQLEIDGNAQMSGGGMVLWNPLETFMPAPPQPVVDDHSPF
ncbi:MAG: hypothetical protein JW782_02980 [Candidatus Saganbacteria bacterium]|nr:hypothetical protein [Candidatus Saganbacteria bacterium]